MDNLVLQHKISVMFKSYLTSAIRSIKQHKLFSVLNIIGLATGMTSSVLILLWVQNEISFDTFHSAKDRIYQVYGLASNVDGKRFAIPVTSQPLGPTLQQNFPEVEASARVKNISSFLVNANGKSFTGIKGSAVDPSFLQLFSFPLMQGNRLQQLQNIYSITITEKLAIKLFGTKEAVGKTIRLDSVDNFAVTGVMKDLPSNTRFDFEYLLPWNYLIKLGQGYSNDSWLSNNTPTFVLLKPNTNVGVFNEKIKDISRLKSGNNGIWTHFLFPLSKWHLYSEFDNGVAVGGRIGTVRVFGIIAAFILLIACINFTNLSTARSEKRAKEVGIRKVAGAGKGLLIAQFIMEAFVTVLIAALIAALLVQLFLPAFNTLIGTQLSIPWTNGYFWLSLIGFILLTSLLAGSYPAFYLSSFKPISIFKKQFRRTNAMVSPRKALVVLQFVFAITLIISTIVVRNQVQFAQDRDKGYSNHDLIRVNFVGDINNNYALIKQELVSSGIASSVTKTMTGITERGGHTWGLRWKRENAKDTNTTITLFSSDADLVKTTGMQLMEGRDINIEKYPADSFSVVLNQTAVKLMGFEKPVGQLIYQPHSNTTWHVVGVVKDYVEGSPYEEIPPTVIAGPAAWFNTMHIKLNPGRAISKNLGKAEQVFKKYNPAYPFDYRFVDQEYAKQFNNEQRTKTMAGLFAGLAIFISCLGLFGLSAYVAESRVKEIGVRKVLGATALNITNLLSFDFLKLVIIAILLAVPLAWYAMHKWLEGYAYRITINWTVFALSGVLALAIALITVSFQSIKAAIANPVNSLRSE